MFARKASLRRYPFVFFGAALALGLVPAVGFGQEDGRRYDDLEPGNRAELNERVPVNFVFVGYERDAVNAENFIGRLPEKYKPVVRSRFFYNESVKGSLLGLNYTYDYETSFAGGRYEKKLFGYLSKIAEPAPLTDYQKLYNGENERFCNPPKGDPQPCQKSGVRNVRNNHHIDAASVEKWLAKNPPVGVNTRRNTVYFINWWGDGEKPREGFKHHVYTKTDEPDPDTGYNFGEERDSRKLIAWGGTTANDEESGLGSTRRVWFHDLSAGPDSFTDNWNVDDPDLTGDGVEDYRLPPIWEYFTNGGYRDESKLTGDLSLLSRYVPINLFFTNSPLYPPEFTPERLPSRVNLDVNTVEGIPGTNSSRHYQTPDLIMDEISEVHRIPYSMDQQDIPYEGKAKECYLEWTAFIYSGGTEGEVCYNQYQNYSPFANLFLYGATNLRMLLDDREPREYQAALLNYAVEDGENFETSPPILGFADDNYRNGTQSFVFNFVSPSIAEESGYGLSTTEIHEYGHHLNLSHPFDGFDYEQAVELEAGNQSPLAADYFPDGQYYLALAGNETNSMMSYVDLNWDFSQFDQDNTNRFQAAAYINNANILAERTLDSPRADLAQSELQAADRYYGRAKAALAEHDYDATFDNARLAYESALDGAREADVSVRASEDGRTAFTSLRGSSKIPGKYVDRPEIGEPATEPGIRSLKSLQESEAYTPSAHRERP